MEEDLQGRFDFFVSKTGIETYTLKLRTNFFKSKFRTVFSRFSKVKETKDEYLKLAPKLVGLKYLFISNPEGYIAKNIILWIKRDYPAIKIISLQHGIFAFGINSLADNLFKNVLNWLTLTLFDFAFLGDGFSKKTTDKYIVYNDLYRNYLLKKGWREDEVIISSYFLKGEEENLDIRPYFENKKNEAILFLQCLAILRLADKEEEEMFVQALIKHFSKSYDKIYVKQHPFAKVELGELPENVTEVENVEPCLYTTKHIYSFFSTVLHDYEKYVEKSIAIKCDYISIKPNIYEQFAYILNYDEYISRGKGFSRNPRRDNSPRFFAQGETSYQNLL